MTRDPISRSFTFLTPAFPHGVYQSQRDNHPELRAPSLRGQLRWWWRTLTRNAEDPLGDALFGSAAGNQGTSSAIQFRLHSPMEPATCQSEILPHKTDRGHRGPKTALAPGHDTFTLELLPRRQGIKPADHNRLADILDAWLLMGAVGQRSNRAAGSPWPVESPSATPVDYLDRCRRLLAGSDLRIALLDFRSDNPNDLRDIAGRFPNTNNTTVLGNVFGSARPRKPSPLRLRAVRLNDTLHLAALWAPITPHEDTPANLQAGIRTLLANEQKRELGQLLESALPELLAG